MMGHNSLDEWKESIKSDFSCDDTTALNYILNDIQNQINNFPDLTSNDNSYTFWVNLKTEVETLLGA
tara:strand:- start:4620 stop:4820 length:201 start_codon:yes stop_codon:yes gene_type:complete